MDITIPSIEKIKIKQIWQKCPNCLGHGTVSFGKRTCVPCQGRGVLLLPVEPVNDDDGGESDDHSNNK